MGQRKARAYGGILSQDGNSGESAEAPREADPMAGAAQVVGKVSQAGGVGAWEGEGQGPGGRCVC